MSRLYRRLISTTINGTQYTNIPRAGETDHIGLRMQFDIKRSVDAKTPDKCTLKLYNLKPESRTAMQAKDAPVKIEAGYFDVSGLIFQGKIARTLSRKIGATWVTEIEITDGGKETSEALTRASHNAGTQLSDVCAAMAKDLKVNISKASQELVKVLKTPDGISQLLNGGAFSGATKNLLDDLLRSAQRAWKIQDEQLVVVDMANLPIAPVTLSPSTGLVESPELGEKGRTRVKSLLQPLLKPLQRVKIDSASIKNAYYAILEVQHVGDTHGHEWYTEIEAKPAQ